MLGLDECGKATTFFTRGPLWISAAAGSEGIASRPYNATPDQG